MKKLISDIEKQAPLAAAVLDNAKDFISVIDGRTFQFLAVSQSLLGLLGKPREEVIGQTCHSLVFGLDRPCEGAHAPCPLRLVRESGEPATVEKIHDAPDGTRRYLEVTASPVRDADGSIPYAVYVVRDISDRKTAELALEEERSRLSTILANSPDGMIYVENATGVVRANKLPCAPLTISRALMTNAADLMARLFLSKLFP